MGLQKVFEEIWGKQIYRGLADGAKDNWDFSFKLAVYEIKYRYKIAYIDLKTN